MIADGRRGLGGADHGPGRRGARRRRASSDEDEEQVAYDLSEWDDDSCVALLDALSADTIPYGLDGDELFVAAVDEKRVDEIVAALTTPGATLTVGGPASFEAMSELFIAADELSNDPDDKGATRAIVGGARAAAGASAPFGTDPGVVGRRRGARRRRSPTSSRPPTPTRSTSWSSPPPSAPSFARTSRSRAVGERPKHSAS